MTSHFNGLSEAEQERLSILIEECGEVIQAASKILRHGYESYNPTIPALDRETNRQALERELGHVRHIVLRMTDAADVNSLAIKRWAAAKHEGIEPYLHHQQTESPEPK